MFRGQAGGRQERERERERRMCISSCESVRVAPVGLCLVGKLPDGTSTLFLVTCIDVACGGREGSNAVRRSSSRKPFISSHIYVERGVGD